MSIQAGGREVYIDYGDKASVRFREYKQQRMRFAGDVPIVGLAPGVLG